MSGNPAAQLLAELFAELGPPAKDANPAKSEHWCGPQADSTAREALRDSANSQITAWIRTGPNRPESEQGCGSSQFSQDSQGVAAQMRFVAWSGADVDRFLEYRSITVRAGFDVDPADEIAERLVIRDRDIDDRRTCLECAIYRPGRCGNYRRAGLQSPDVGRALSSMLQRCPGFEASR